MANQTDKDLKKCLNDANGDAAKVTACLNTYKAATGATTVDGKVFVQPNGDATFVSTNGGKVFLGGKVF